MNENCRYRLWYNVRIRKEEGDKNLERIRVCKHMFGGILGLKQAMVFSWDKTSIRHNGDKDTKTDSGYQVSRKSDIKRAKLLEKMQLFTNFSIRFQKWTVIIVGLPQKIIIFNHFGVQTVFEEYNLSPFMPKDLCDVCEAYKSKKLV
nr:unnamed protein product [Callosobruchus analis]